MNTHTKIQLNFKCENLLDMDVTSKSDPYVVVKEGQREVGRTEVVRNTLNPVFQRYVEMDFFFEVRQELQFLVMDKDKHGTDDFLGSATMTLGEIISSRDSSKTAKLSAKRGTITVTVSGSAASSAVQGTLSLRFIGKDLKKMDVFGKSDPYFILSYKLPNGQLRQVFRSQCIKKTLNPQWEPTTDLNIMDLCGGDIHTPCIQFSCFDKDRVNDDPMGAFMVSAEQLMKGTGEFELTAVKKDKTKSYGTICLVGSQFIKTTTFLEHMQRGLQLNIAFSIDFTASNGHWQDPRSLHFYDPRVPNNYIKAMLAVSSVVQEYDTDKQFPVYGFGAETPFQVNTMHFFPLTGNYQNAYVNGMQAVINTYAGLLPQLRFSGPTNFAPTIRAITEGAWQAKGVYTILMIMTDGAITDMRDTIDVIVAADDAPLSIIIIGIGNSDFSSMSQLDGDGGVLRSSTGNVRRRDLVQFVPFNQFANAPPERLAAAVLEEVPRQVEVWGRLNGIQ